MQTANMANPLRSLRPTKLQPYFYRCFHTRRRCVPGDFHLRIACFPPWRLRQPDFRRTLVVQQVGPQMPQPPNEADGPESAKAKEPESHDWGLTMFKMAEAALTTFASVAILGCVSLSFGNISSLTYVLQVLWATAIRSTTSTWFSRRWRMLSSLEIQY